MARKMVVQPALGGALWEVVWDGGGRIALPLQGKYTSQKVAEKAVRQYLEMNKDTDGAAEG